MLEGAAPYNTLDEVGYMSKVVVYVNPRQYDRIIRRRIERARFLERRGKPKPVYVPIGIRELSMKNFQNGTLVNGLDGPRKLENHIQNGLVTGINNTNAYLNNPVTSTNPIKTNFNNGVGNTVFMSNGCPNNGIPGGNIASATITNGPLQETEPVKHSDEGVANTQTTVGTITRNSTILNAYSSPNLYNNHEGLVTKRDREEFENTDNSAKRARVGEFAAPDGPKSSPFGPVPNTQYLNGHCPDVPNFHRNQSYIDNGTSKANDNFQHNGDVSNGYEKFVMKTGFGATAQAASNLYSPSTQENTNTLYIKNNAIPNINSLNHSTSTGSGTASTERVSARYTSKSREEIKNNYLHLNSSPYSKSSIDSEIVPKTEQIYNINHQGIVMDMSPNKTLKFGIEAGIGNGIPNSLDGRMSNMDDFGGTSSIERTVAGSSDSVNKDQYMILNAINRVKAGDEGDEVGVHPKGELGGGEDFDPNKKETENDNFGGGSRIYRELCNCFQTVEGNAR